MSFDSKTFNENCIFEFTLLHTYILTKTCESYKPALTTIFSYNLCTAIDSTLSLSSDRKMERSGDIIRRKTAEGTPAVVVKETTSLSTLEYYLYGKNIVYAIDMENIRKQRCSIEPGSERNNNGEASHSKGIYDIFLKKDCQSHCFKRIVKVVAFLSDCFKNEKKN